MVRLTTLSVCVSFLFFLHLVFFVHGKDETNQLLVGNGDSAHMVSASHLIFFSSSKFMWFGLINLNENTQGRADHECRGKERGECKKKLGDEETLYENEDYIYTQSNP
uniref:Phytosulfokine-beta n=1 Tax=Salix viminalis TaxID=40686 RepID=A0A6N2LL31_SALVM